jgi:N-acetyl-gamma-glutamyl-phosphate reductase
MTNLFSTAILGANGYSGRELARLLLNHPNAELIATLGRKTDWHLSEELPECQAQAIKHYSIDELTHVAQDLDTIFLATPPEISLNYVLPLMEMGVKIIDLSGALRLSAEDFAIWYGFSHPFPELLKQVQYGLSPWWANHTTALDCNLIANPGCYATCAQMALLPLLIADIIQAESLIIDAKSGLTGAGRHPKENLLFCEISHDFYPYKIGSHQHTPEIQTHLNQFTQKKLKHHSEFSRYDFSNLLLNTHILPIKRGISMSIYSHLNPNMLTLEHEELSSKINQAYQQAYHDYPLIRCFDLNSQSPSQQKNNLSLNKVVGSARTHVAWRRHFNQVIIFATLDNLLKGAASQAIENFNWIHGIPCSTSLEKLEGLL